MNEMSFIDKLMSRDLLYYLIEKTVRKRYVLSEKMFLRNRANC